MPRDPDAPGDGAMFAQTFTPSLGTSGRVNSLSFNSRVLLLIPTVRTPPNSGAGFKSAYGIEGTIFLASYFQKRWRPTTGSEYAMFLIMMFRIAHLFEMTVSRSTGSRLSMNSLISGLFFSNIKVGVAVGPYRVTAPSHSLSACVAAKGTPSS